MKIYYLMIAYGKNTSEPILELNIPGDDCDPESWRPHARAIAKQLVKADYRSFEIYEQIGTDWVKTMSFSATIPEPVLYGGAGF